MLFVSVVATSYLQQGTLFGCESLYIRPHMNFDQCVLNFIFCMCSLVVTMEIHYY